MEKPKYLYIDDENGTSEISTLNGFNDLNQIGVERFPLADFREFGSLKKELAKRSKKGEFDGLILDLRLDGTGADRTEFNATALAQELRSVAARGDMATFPIVLCSTEAKIKDTYSSDKTSHDLFDYKIYKSNPKPNWAKLSLKLYSLANGYKILNSNVDNLGEIFGIKDEKELDARILERFATFSVNYDYSHFVIKNFFHQTNPLINERILAARLGIDLNKTPEDDWKKLIELYFNDAKYSGIFSDGWDRWWSDKIVDIFYTYSKQRLSFSKASERVEKLKEISGITTLVDAKPLKFCNSTEFWSICEAYKVPIDPLEGFKVLVNAELKPWQESKYISLLAILEREGFVDRGLRPHPSEIENIEYTTELHGIKWER
ncbi:hypothetical protein HZQ80_05920 [Elizabethkingia anophelis]|nr:hypothetical protein [Elizabethkingia anophelis]